MKILYFDCFSGISGDMALGALLDLGIDKELFKKELDKLNLPGYEIIISNTTKNGIIGTDVLVKITDEYGKLEENPGKHRHDLHGYSHAHTHEDHDHAHTYGHVHVHGHYHGDSHDHGYAGNHSDSRLMRNLRDIETIIDSSGVDQNVKDLSKRIFREIAKAEAKVHNVNVEDVTFHEVGAIDSIVDIVGVSICINLLGIQKVFSSPLHDGKGFIECQHGIIPVPVPAVMEMLAESNIPLICEDINTELITPTGMGIIKCLATDFGNMPAMMIDKIGYGMGKRDTGKLNALRVVMGTLFDGDGMMEEVALLETNIDNMSAELLGFTMERLFEAGALDVFYTPIYMKKNRPAVMLTVLTGKENEEKVVDLILRETSTLGIRRNIVKRYCMDREIVKVDTEYGPVRVKVSTKGKLKKLAPEYEDCREIALRTGIPLGRIYDAVHESSKYLLLQD